MTDFAAIEALMCTLPVEQRKQLVVALIWTLPVEQRKQLVPKYFALSALRRCRNDLLLQLAVGKWDAAETIATEIHQEIENYRQAAWKFEKDRTLPTDPRRRAIYRILTLVEDMGTRGTHDGLSVRNLRRLYAGVANGPRLVGHNSMPDSRTNHLEDENGDVECGAENHGRHRGQSQGGP